MAIVENDTDTLAQMVSRVYSLVNEGEEVFPKTDVVFAVNTGLGIVFNTSHREPIEIYSSADGIDAQFEIPETLYIAGDAVIDDALVDDVSVSFTVNSNVVTLDEIPTAGQTVTIIYRPEFMKLVNDSDTTSMSDMEIRAGLMYACYLLKMQDEEFNSAQFFKTTHDELMMRVSMVPTGVYVWDEDIQRGVR